jgi:hypothetical protein
VVGIGHLHGNGMGTLRTVGGNRLGLVGLEEVQIEADLVVLAMGNLGCGKASEYLIGPNVIEPLQ